MGAKKLVGRLSRRSWLIIGVVAILAIGASVWAYIVLFSAEAEAEEITQTSAASVETMQKVVSASGTVSPSVKEDVSFAASGVVTEVLVSAGDVVEAGAVLARIDPLELNAALLEARATLAEAQASLASSEESDDDSSASDARIAAASAAVDVAAANVTEAEAAVADADLVAPAAGLVTNVSVAVGDRVGSSSGTSSGGMSAGTGAADTSSSGAAFSIVSTDSWTLEVSIGETDVANVQAGLQVELTTSDGGEYFGTVREVGRVPSTTSGSARYPVTIDITGTGDGLYDGVSVDAEIVYERRTDVLTVPSAAVTTSDGTSVVTTIDENGDEQEVEVETGESSGSLIEIVSGLEEGDEVIVATFTPGEGNSGGGTQGGEGTFPGGGEFPSDGEFPGGTGGGMPGGTGGGFPGGDQ